MISDAINVGGGGGGGVGILSDNIFHFYINNSGQ